jgi:maltose-binding protein MalE
MIVELSTQFSEEYGINVDVETMSVQTMSDSLITAVLGGAGPDLIVMPHDNVGRLVENNVIASIDLDDKANSFLPSALDAFRYDGALYGVPFVMENVGFFRNVDFIPDAPQTWDEVAEVGRELVDSRQVEYAIALPDLSYHLYPVYTAFGGYIFGRDENGRYTAGDVGMDSDGMIAGAEWANTLIRDGYVTENLDWEAAHMMFESGQVPFIITGPWAIERFQASGISYAVSAFPAAEVGGRQGAPLVGVEGFLVNATSPNLLLAQAFVTEFVATENVQQFLVDSDRNYFHPRSSAWVSIFEAIEDADERGFAEAGANGQPIPTLPEMRFVWDAWANAAFQIVGGELTPREALTEAANQIRTQIEEGSG